MFPPNGFTQQHAGPPVKTWSKDPNVWPPNSKSIGHAGPNTQKGNELHMPTLTRKKVHLDANKQHELSHGKKSGSECAVYSNACHFFLRPFASSAGLYSIHLPILPYMINTTIILSPLVAPNRSSSLSKGSPKLLDC